MDLLSNDGSFSLGNFLGDGQYGHVYTCVYKNIEAVIKLCVSEYEDEIPTAVICEIAMLQLLYKQHPNILSIYAIDEFSYKGVTHIGIIMPHLDKDLYKIISDDTLHTELKKRELDIIRGITRGLQFLHINKIIHRDLKIDNIMLHNWNPIIIDFGFAKQVNHINYKIRNDVYIGSKYSRAPEIYKRIPYDLSSDIWSLGIIIHELTTRKIIHGISEKIFHEKIIREYSQDISTSDSMSLPVMIIKLTLVMDPDKRITANHIRALLGVEGQSEKIINLFPGVDLPTLDDYTSKQFPAESNPIVMKHALLYNKKYPEFSLSTCYCIAYKLFENDTPVQIDPPPTIDEYRLLKKLNYNLYN
jgi:serine/threonine protein kinase